MDPKVEVVSIQVDVVVPDVPIALEPTAAAVAAVVAV